MNYQLPFGKSLTGVEGVLVKDWAVNTGGSWQTGLPFSVTNATSSSISGINANGYVDQTCNAHISGATLLQWFNYNCFVQQTPGTLGRQAPNQFFGPSQKAVSISLSKEFAIKESIKLQFRTEIFNAFNNVNFNTPSGTALTFGALGGVRASRSRELRGPGSSITPAEITALNANWSPRQIQFALKLLF